MFVESSFCCMKSKLFDVTLTLFLLGNIIYMICSNEKEWYKIQK